MRNCKCADCAEYINQWCRKVKDSPCPDLIRDCEYFHDIETNVEKIIRCKDCKHYDGRYCHHKGYGNGYAHYTPPIKSEEGFCDWAKEREEE